MKSIIGLSILVAMMTCGGCLIISDCGNPCKTKPECPNCKPPAFVVQREPMMAEVDAACSLISETDKFQLFAAFVSRPVLSDSAQVYLVRKTAECFISENSKLDILLALISNPAFSPAAKNEILAKLNMFISENSKRAILEEFNKLALKATQTPLPVVAPGPAPVTP
jgi:hypothetical protein